MISLGPVLLSDTIKLLQGIHWLGITSSVCWLEQFAGPGNFEYTVLTAAQVPSDTKRRQI